MREALARWRNRLFMSRRFQRTALSLPIVKGIAKRRASALFDLCAGFVYSQVLLACTELNLFETLRTGSRPIDALADEVGVPGEALLRLGKAAQALDLLTVTRNGQYLALGAQGAALLGNPSVFDMVHHHRLLYKDLTDPVHLLRQTKGETHLGRYWGYARQQLGVANDDGEPEAYSRLMRTTQAFVSEEILAAVNFDRYQHVMDVGGGSGAFLSALGQAYPEPKLGLFDLPPVIPEAEKNLTAHGLAGRCNLFAGNFHEDDLPASADFISLIRILHDHDDREVEQLLRKVHAALPPDGTLMVAEPMAGTEGAQAMGDAYFGIYLWAMGTGEPRSQNRLVSMMREAGFSRVKPRKTRNPLLTGVILGRK